MSHTLKNLLLILISLLLFGGAYAVLRNADTTETGVGFMDEQNDVTVRTNQILSDTKRIDGYKLDVSIFTDQRFSTLKDTHVNIPDTYTGRPNPFRRVE